MSVPTSTLWDSNCAWLENYYEYEYVTTNLINMYNYNVQIKNMGIKGYYED